MLNIIYSLLKINLINVYNLFTENNKTNVENDINEKTKFWSKKIFKIIAALTLTARVSIAIAITLTLESDNGANLSLSKWVLYEDVELNYSKNVNYIQDIFMNYIYL